MSVDQTNGGDSINRPLRRIVACAAGVATLAVLAVKFSTHTPGPPDSSLQQAPEDSTLRAASEGPAFHNELYKWWSIRGILRTVWKPHWDLGIIPVLSALSYPELVKDKFLEGPYLILPVIMVACIWLLFRAFFAVTSIVAGQPTYWLLDAVMLLAVSLLASAVSTTILLAFEGLFSLESLADLYISHISIVVQYTPWGLGVGLVIAALQRARKELSSRGLMLTIFIMLIAVSLMWSSNRLYGYTADAPVHLTPEGSLLVFVKDPETSVDIDIQVSDELGNDASQGLDTATVTITTSGAWALILSGSWLPVSIDHEAVNYSDQDILSISELVDDDVAFARAEIGSFTVRAPWLSPGPYHQIEGDGPASYEITFDKPYMREVGATMSVLFSSVGCLDSLNAAMAYTYGEDGRKSAEKELNGWTAPSSCTVTVGGVKARDYIPEYVSSPTFYPMVASWRKSSEPLSYSEGYDVAKLGRGEVSLRLLDVTLPAQTWVGHSATLEQENTWRQAAGFAGLGFALGMVAPAVQILVEAQSRPLRRRPPWHIDMP